MAALGLLAGEIGGALMHFPPFLPQHVLQNPIAVAALVFLALGTVTSLVLWAGPSHDRPERLAFVAAIASVGALAVVVNVLAPRLGWWSGPVFEGPLLPLALLTGLRAMFLLALVLLMYRWLAARRPSLALLIYGLILLALIPVTVRGDRMVLDSRVLTFGGGYEIWHDVVLAEAFFALPLVVYEMCRRRWHRGPHESALSGLANG